MPAPEPAGAERDADYYRADYGRYEPDWIPPPHDVSPSVWDRYVTSQPGSEEHKAAYADMHRAASGRGFPGPDPEQSYLDDHGYGTGPDRFRAPDPGEDFAEPDGAYPADPADRERPAPDHLYGAPECAEADPETAHFGEHSPEAGDRGHWPVPRVPDATLPDGTPHADPFLAGRGWQAHGGVCVRQPQVQAEAG